MKLLIILLSFFCFNTFAYNNFSLSIKDAVKLALEHHEDIRISKVEIEKFEYQYKEALSLALPKISAGLTWSNYLKSPILSADLGSPFGSVSIPIKENYELDFNTTLTQPVWTFGKVSTALDIADEAREAQQFSHKAKMNEIKYQTKFLYYTVLFTQKIYDIAKKSYKNTLRNKKRLRDKFRFGRISRYDNVKMSADVASRIPSMLEAENNADLAKRNLKLITGIDENIKIHLSDYLSKEFPTFENTNLKSTMLDNEPSLKALKRNIAIQQNLAKLQKSNYYPSIGFFTTYQYTGHYRDVFVGRNNMYHMLVVGFSITGNIWDSGETHSRYQQALKDTEIAELQYIKAQKGYKQQLDSAIAEYNALVETYKANLVTLNLANKSYKISLSSFTSGKVTQTQLNDAELMLTRTKLGTEQTLYKINNLIAKIHKLSVKEN